MALAVGCGRDGANLPKAAGVSGDMFLVMDSTQWKGSLGRVVDSLFRAGMEGLPRDEAIFNMKWIDPRRLNFVLKQSRNLIFLVTLDQHTEGSETVRRLFTKASLDKIKADPSLYVETTPNLFAKGQEVMFLFGMTEDALLAKLRQNGPALVDYFDRKERERLTVGLFKGGRAKGVSDWLQKNYKVDMQVPYGYKLVQNEDDFLWVRQINPSDDKSVFIYRTDYTSVDQFKRDSLIAHRNEVCRKYLFEDPEVGDTYLVTEMGVDVVPVITKEISYDGNFAVEMRGLWRTNNKSMGGPFVGYAMADPAAGKFYYVEGFAFAPGKQQREIVRELETILHTFKMNVTPAASK